MGFVPFDKVAKVEAVFLKENQYSENVFHYWTESEWTVEKLEEVASLWIAWWDTHAQGGVSSDTSLVKIKATILDTISSPGIEYTTGLPLAGGSAGNPMPANVSFAVRWLTGYRGRSYRGRTYHIGMVEGEADGSTLTAGAQAYWIGKYELLITLDGVVDDYLLGVASRVSNGVERTTGVFTPITGVYIDPVVDSQRRRLPGRGR